MFKWEVVRQSDVSQIGDGRAFQHPARAGFIRRTELSATTKLSSGDETPPMANVLLWEWAIV